MLDAIEYELAFNRAMRKLEADEELITVYHGTSSQLGRRIERSGVLRRRPADSTPDLQERPPDWRGVYVTTNRSKASWFALRQTAHFIHKHHGGRDGAIVTAKAPLPKLSPDPECKPTEEGWVVDAQSLSVEGVEYVRFPRLAIEISASPPAEIPEKYWSTFASDYCPIGGRECWRDSLCARIIDPAEVPAIWKLTPPLRWYA